MPTPIGRLNIQNTMSIMIYTTQKARENGTCAARKVPTQELLPSFLPIYPSSIAKHITKPENTGVMLLVQESPIR